LLISNLKKKKTYFELYKFARSRKKVCGSILKNPTNELQTMSPINEVNEFPKGRREQIIVYIKT